MYKQVRIDLTRYEPIYEYPVGRIEYNLIDMPESYSRNSRTKFEYKRCIFEPDMHFGEMTGYMIAKKIGISCCDVELFSRPYRNKPELSEVGAISYFYSGSDDDVFTSSGVVTKHAKKNKIEDDYMPDINTIFAAVYDRFKEDERPISEFLKFKKDFIMMTVFDLKFGNFDRGLNNWYLIKDKKTGRIDLYPMFDNEAVLGFTDDIPEDTSYASIADFNNIRKSRVTIPRDRVERKYTDFRDMYRYLLEYYPIETIHATKMINKFKVGDLDEILNNLPELSDERKKFAKKNYMYRQMTMDKLYLDYLDKRKRSKTVALNIVPFDQRMSS